MNVSEQYLRIDEIDHVTHAYNLGKGLDVPHAVRLIRYYSAADSEVGKATKQYDPIFSDLTKLSDEQLAALLVVIRTILINRIWPEGGASK